MYSPGALHVLVRDVLCRRISGKLNSESYLVHVCSHLHDRWIRDLLAHALENAHQLAVLCNGTLGEECRQAVGVLDLLVGFIEGRDERRLDVISQEMNYSADRGAGQLGRVVGIELFLE